MHDSADVHMRTIGIDGQFCYFWCGCASSMLHCFRRQQIIIMQVPNNWFTLLQDVMHHTLYETDHDSQFGIATKFWTITMRAYAVDFGKHPVNFCF